MNLDEAQKKTVASWIASGLKLSEIQQRLASELGLNLTYMEVRLLVDDLKLTPKDIDRPKTTQLPAPTAGASTPSAPGGKGAMPGGPQPVKPGGVSLTVDEIARPGALASGRVTFSDGNTAEWYLDEMGRLGLLPQQQGYRPSQVDVQAFQRELQTELGRLGL